MNVRDRIVSWATLLCFAAGAALGLIRPDWAQGIGFIGTAYVTVLKYLALPMLILAVFCAAMKGGRNAAGTLFRAVTLFALMFVASFLLCAVPYGLFAPGKSFSMTGETAWEGERAAEEQHGSRQKRTAAQLPESEPVDFLPLKKQYHGEQRNRPHQEADAVEGEGAEIGIAFGALHSERLAKGAAAAEDFFRKLLSWVMILTPLGVLSLMAKLTGTFGAEALRSSGAYIAWAYGGCLLVLGLVMILPLWVLCRVSPGQYFRRTGRLFLTAISTCSSAATLPETMRTCRESFGASERPTGIVAPLGCTIHMCGGAVSFRTAVR